MMTDTRPSLLAEFDALRKHEFDWERFRARLAALDTAPITAEQLGYVHDVDGDLIRPHAAPRAYRGEHVFLRHRPGECVNEGHCNICDGGLGVCVVCNEAESGLAKLCPGRPVTAPPLAVSGPSPYTPGAHDPHPLAASALGVDVIRELSATVETDLKCLLQALHDASARREPQKHFMHFDPSKQECDDAVEAAVRDIELYVLNGKIAAAQAARLMSAAPVVPEEVVKALATWDTKYDRGWQTDTDFAEAVAPWVRSLLPKSVTP